MSLFKLDNILLNENNNIDIDKIVYLDTSLQHHSFVQEGYDFILSINESYTMAEKIFCENILNSYGDDIVINESFSGFFDKIKAIINKFIEWVKRTFKQFVVKINAFLSSDKYIKKNSDQLSKFSSEDEFDIEGYRFTNIADSKIPLANAEDAFKKGTSDEGFLGINNIYGGAHSSSISKDNIENYVQGTNNKIDSQINNVKDNLEDFYDKFRGQVISESDSIEANKFSNELFKKFRDNNDSVIKITVDSTFVSDAYKRFDKHKDVINSIDKIQKDIIKDYEELEKFLDKAITLVQNKTQSVIKINKSPSNKYAQQNIDTLKKGTGTMDGEEIFDKSTFDKINSYLKIQVSKVNTMCSIHTQAFTAKLEACKDCFIQDKKVLYKALNNIAKHKEENK